jgi:hypothetical protein
MRSTTFVQERKRWLLTTAMLMGVLLPTAAFAQSATSMGTEANPLTAPTQPTSSTGTTTDLSTVTQAELPEGAEEDHLKCYSVVKDSAATKDAFLVNLFNEQFGEETGCALVTKARMFCTPAAKGVEPNPLGDDSRGPQLESSFLCYRIQCPNSERREIALVDDQFGTRSITVKSSRFLCAPVAASTMSSLPCGQSAPECNGTCDPGQECQPAATGNTCSCEPTP